VFRNILGTTFTRFFNALLAFGILYINTNHLGQEGLGTISLILLGITLVVMINNFVGGGALVYLVPRHHTGQLYVPSAIWAVLTSVAGASVLRISHLIPSGYTWHVMALALIQSLTTINLNILLGKEKIKIFNAVSVLQMALTILTLVFLIYVRHKVDVMAYVLALYAGYLFAFIISMAAVWRFLILLTLSGIRHVVNEMFKYGKFVQFANILQLLNYRLAYYLIEFFIGRAALGLYTVGVQISEGVWLVGKSVATVQYARISNTADPESSKNVTLRLFKFTLVVTLLAMAVLLLLPESVYGAVFGQAFTGVRLVMMTLALGIVATAASMMFSHYFSGTGRPHHNMIGSAIGLVFTLVPGLIFIPRYGLLAAGIIASVSYIMNMTYLLVVFINVTGAKAHHFIIGVNDIRFALKELRKLRAQA